LAAGIGQSKVGQNQNRFQNLRTLRPTG